MNSDETSLLINKEDVNVQIYADKELVAENISSDMSRIINAETPESKIKITKTVSKMRNKSDFNLGSVSRCKSRSKTNIKMKKDEKTCIDENNLNIPDENKINKEIESNEPNEVKSESIILEIEDKKNQEEIKGFYILKLV